MKHWLIDTKAEAEFARVQALVEAIRNVRGERQVNPKKRIKLLASANASQVVGRAVIKPMVAGQPFTRTSFVPEGTGPHLAAILQPGMRAVTVQVSEYAGLEGILYPGSVVDVL